jgi:hypothetical protein
MKEVSWIVAESSVAVCCGTRGLQDLPGVFKPYWVNGCWHLSLTKTMNMYAVHGAETQILSEMVKAGESTPSITEFKTATMYAVHGVETQAYIERYDSLSMVLKPKLLKALGCSLWF